MSMAMPVDRVSASASAREPVPTRRMPRAERREQIARTAATVFVCGGFDGTSMDDVAREAGVTRLIVYRIFESKEELYRAVLDLVIDDLAAFRLLWRHAAHEPAFREVAALFKRAVTDHAIVLIEPAMSDPTLRRWAAESVVSHLYESVCLWLDDGDIARDDEFVVLITEGIRAMVIRWIELAGAAR
ncbi:MAG: TetR family transcriptional regulator [Acidimicrobiaceae bacterium]|nr:MAG: TetR family transcriptional regulator [Acidimicrobiaceae bacterium]